MQINKKNLFFQNIKYGKMTTKLPLHEVAYFNAEHSKFSVKNLLNGSGKWTTPVNSKLDKLEVVIQKTKKII